MPTTDLPEPIPGADLADLRKRLGVTQIALADAIGIHRTRLNAWERATPLDAIRSVRYQQALRRIVERAVA